MSYKPQVVIIFKVQKQQSTYEIKKRQSKQFQRDNWNNFMRYQTLKRQPKQASQQQPTKMRPQVRKYRELLSQMQQESFYDDSLFFDKKNLFSLVNPPPKKIKTIYHKIILSNKNDPLYPNTYRKYVSQSKTRSEKRGRSSLELEGQNNDNSKFSTFQFGKVQMLNNIKDRLKQKGESLSKDRKRFFKNLLQKFTQNCQDDNSIHYKQKIHLFKKVFEHYKIRPQEKQHFDQLLKKISQKQLSTIQPQSKISTKMNLQCRKFNYSVGEKRAISPKQMKLRIKDKLAKTSHQRRNILENNLLQMASIQARNNKNKSLITSTEQFKSEISQMSQIQKQLSARKINEKTIQQETQASSNISRTNRRTKIMDKKLTSTLVYVNKQQTPIDIKLHKFREFLFAINFSNHLFVPLEVQKYPTTFKIFIGKGNNSNLIKSIFKRRFWFQVTKNIQEAHFVWTQLKQETIFEKQESRKYLLNQKISQKQEINTTKIQDTDENNQFQTQVNPEKQLSSEKNKLQAFFSEPHPTEQVKVIDFKSLKMKKKPEISKFISVQSQRLYRSNKKGDKSDSESTVRQNIIKIKKHPQILMLKNIMSKNSDPLDKIICSQQMKQFETLYSRFLSNPSKQFGNKIPSFQQRKNDIISNTNGFALKETDKIKQVIHNHLPFNGILGNKKAMFYILKQYCDLTQTDLFRIVPLTFHIKHGMKDEQYKKFSQQFESRKKNKKINYWVMKPGQFSNRGNGIQCTNKIQQIKKRIQGCMNKNNAKKTKAPLTSKSLILQSYITDILLYNGRKFDIRAYMMVTIVNGKIKAYWYEQGYIRTSSYIWSLNDIEDRQIHLTNDAVQKYSDTYGKYEMGNKLSYRDIQRYLESNEKASKNVVYEKILPQMKQIATLSLKASYLFLDPAKLQNNFEIFGFDFMLDNKLKPWLIQINTNPCLQLGCPILQRIIPNMLQNAFRIAIDPLFPPPSAFSSNYKYNIAQNAVNYNKFDLIFDEDRDGPEIQRLYQSKSLQQILTKIEDIQQDKQTFEEDGDEIDLSDQI